MRAPTPDVPVGTPEHHLKAREEFWHGLWEPLPGIPADPCLGLKFPPVHPEDLASLPRPSFDRCRQVCRKYRARAAVGLDGMHPRHHAQLYDGVSPGTVWHLASIIAFGTVSSCPGSIYNELSTQVGRRRAHCSTVLHVRAHLHSFLPTRIRCELVTSTS